MVFKVIECDTFLLSQSELNRNLEWEPNTNKGNKVNSNRWKKSSGRHLVSRNAPCRESQDDWKKRKDGKSGRKKLRGKLRRATFSWFGQSRRTMHEWNFSCFGWIILEWNYSAQFAQPFPLLIFGGETTRRQGNSRGQLLWPEILVGHSWLSWRSRTEEEDRRIAKHVRAYVAALNVFVIPPHPFSTLDCGWNWKF